MTELTAQEARRLLRYDPETGHLYWRVRHCLSIPPETKAGSINRLGYMSVNIHGVKYQAHRVAWLIFYGDWPEFQIDHINKNPLDNRIKNLRDVTASENCRNKKRKARGVSLHKKTGKYQVQVCLPVRRLKYVGLYATEKEAVAAYLEAAEAEGVL